MFYDSEWGCTFDSEIEKLAAECSSIEWFDPCNEIWENRFSEKKEFELRQAFVDVGRFDDYINGIEEI